MIEYRLAPSRMLLWVITVYSIDARAVNFGNDVRLQGVTHVHGLYMGQ